MTSCCSPGTQKTLKNLRILDWVHGKIKFVPLAANSHPHSSRRCNGRELFGSRCSTTKTSSRQGNSLRHHLWIQTCAADNLSRTAGTAELSNLITASDDFVLEKI